MVFSMDDSAGALLSGTSWYVGTYASAVLPPGFPVLGYRQQLRCVESHGRPAARMGGTRREKPHVQDQQPPGCQSMLRDKNIYHIFRIGRPYPTAQNV